jgi:hypothetical protein
VSSGPAIFVWAVHPYESVSNPLQFMLQVLDTDRYGTVDLFPPLLAPLIENLVKSFILDFVRLSVHDGWLAAAAWGPAASSSVGLRKREMDVWNRTVTRL